MENSVLFFSQISDFFDYLGSKLTHLIKEYCPCMDLNPSFPFYCSKHYADLIKNSNEPLALAQEILPSKKELIDVPTFVEDPVGDLLANKSERILQKYDNRALIIATSACGVRCRFCFRRNYPFQNSKNITQEVHKWLKDHTDIWEIILSGGDPLTLYPQEFENLVESIAIHENVTTLRIHTRLPIMRPDLVNKHLNFLCELPKRFDSIFVTHVNHPDELDKESESIFKKLKNHNWTLLNQNVLLKGINDNEDTLINLSRKLFRQGVIPYYLHQLDHAKGVAHFEVNDEKAKKLIEKIRTKLPGYLVPTLVRELANEKSKTPIK